MPNVSLTQARLREMLDYDPETGVFRWKIRGRGYPGIGKVAGGTSHKYGYRTISVDKRKYLAHRLAWLYVRGEFPPDELDHVDRNTDNNAIANLRPCTHQQNQYNRVDNSGKASRFRGVSWSKRRQLWMARIYENGKCRFLGRFSREEDAARAYAEAKKEIDPFT